MAEKQGTLCRHRWSAPTPKVTLTDQGQMAEDPTYAVRHCLDCEEQRTELRRQVTPDA